MKQYKIRAKVKKMKGTTSQSAEYSLEFPKIDIKNKEAYVYSILKVLTELSRNSLDVTDTLLILVVFMFHHACEKLQVKYRVIIECVLLLLVVVVFK